ncbi:hypothetical protein [Streptomyces sp. 4F14]|uniref:hypothetical protein n=1 Tax=Streptomyces sp. 4F14 TaxID=3394380 RepID=UPI003A898CA2
MPSLTRRYPLARIESVDQAKALRLICPLPDGAVVGLRQVARRGDVVITAELAQTIREDTWSGIRIRIVSPSAGAVDANWFGFSQYDVFNGRYHAPSARDCGELARYNAHVMLVADGIDARRLRDAAAEYTAAFAPPPAPEFTAAAHLGALFSMARRLDHLGSIKPKILAGRAFAHAEVLRDVAGEIHLDLLPLTGERQAADSAPVEVTEGLADLRKLRTALAALAHSADLGDHSGYGEIFRGHAANLDGIDHEITTDLAADRAAAEGARPSAAVSTSPTALATSGADRSGASTTPFASTPDRAAERGRR